MPLLQVLSSGNERMWVEGCLSIPGYTALTRRPSDITVRYQDLDGVWHQGDVHGFPALLFQVCVAEGHGWRCTGDRARSLDGCSLSRVLSTIANRA